MPLDKAGKKYVQEVMGVFLFYAWAVYNTMLVALSAIALEQAKPTEKTLHKVKQFLDYAASNPDAILMYQASNMVLTVHSNTSYLNKQCARSRARGHFYLWNNQPFPPNNGTVLNVATIIKA